VQLKACLCISGTELIIHHTANIVRSTNCLLQTVFFPHLVCAKLVGSNTNVYASTFQRKVYFEISVHSLPSQFRTESSLLQRTGSWNCAECAANNCEYNTIPTMYAVKHNRMPCTGYESGREAMQI
jgi:hypothetical protein